MPLILHKSRVSLLYFRKIMKKKSRKIPLIHTTFQIFFLMLRSTHTLLGYFLINCRSTIIYYISKIWIYPTYLLIWTTHSTTISVFSTILRHEKSMKISYKSPYCYWPKTNLSVLVLNNNKPFFSITE